MQDSSRSTQRPMGFAGLASMVSDVDDIVAEEVKKCEKTPPPPPISSAETTVAPYVPPDPAPSQDNAFAARASGKADKADKTGRNWLIAIAIFLAIGWLLNHSNDKPSTAAPAYNTAANDTPVSNNPPVQQPPVAQDVEVLPPVGSNMVLSRAQLHYCFAENIRLEAGREVLDPQRQSDTTRFNNMVSDYNSRCASYRYRHRDFDAANSDVQGRLYEYQSAGRQRFINR